MQEPINEFAVVNFGNDTTQASELSRIVARSFGFSDDSRYRVWFEGVFSREHA